METQRETERERETYPPRETSLPCWLAMRSACTQGATFGSATCCLEAGLWRPVERSPAPRTGHMVPDKVITQPRWSNGVHGYYVT